MLMCWDRILLPLQLHPYRQHSRPAHTSRTDLSALHRCSQKKRLRPSPWCLFTQCVGAQHASPRTTTMRTMQVKGNFTVTLMSTFLPLTTNTCFDLCTHRPSSDLARRIKIRRLPNPNSPDTIALSKSVIVKGRRVEDAPIVPDRCHDVSKKYDPGLWEPLLPKSFGFRHLNLTCKSWFSLRVR